MKSWRYFLLIVGLIGWFGVSYAREVRIHVVATTDVHARLFPYDFVNDRPERQSLANVMYMLEIARLRQSGSIILLDNGDLLQGTPAAYYANFVQDSKNNLFSRVMNLMKYDAATIGNHDIEAGPDVYNRLKKEYRFPLLGANVLNAATGEPYFVPYTMIRRQGVRIAVLGLTTPSVPKWLPPKLWEGLAFQDMVEAARYWVQHIQENEKPDAIVGLFHSGMGPINAAPEAHPLENASAYIARHVPGFQVIFTGHDHIVRTERIINVAGHEVLILGGGSHARNLAVADLIFDRSDRRQLVFKEAKGEIVTTNNIAPSQSFFRMFDKDVTEIIAFAGKEVGHLAENINTVDALFGSAPLSDLVHHVQLEITGANISITAPLAFDETIRAGMLRNRDFFRLYEYENYLYTMELTGWEVLYLLEYSYDLWLNQMRSPEDRLLRFRLDENGRIPEGTAPRRMLEHPFFNYDAAAGIKYVVDVRNQAGCRVHIVSMEDGEAFDIDKTYRVAINSYRGSGGGGHLTEGAGIPAGEIPGRIVAVSDNDLRSAMIEYFRNKGSVDFPVRNNWKMIPENWVDQAKSRDLDLLRNSR